MSSSPSMFDQHKLNWMNGQYIKKLSDEEYLKFIKPYLAKAINIENFDDEKLLFLGNMFKEQIQYGEEIVNLIKPMYEYKLEESEEALAMLNLETTPLVLKTFAIKLEQADNLEPETLKVMFKEIANETGVKGKALYMPLRLKITGQMHGAELVNIIKLLGKEEILKRVNA